jgi:phosphoribosylanthranilate isomerase
MLKIKVKADAVDNLTDARYFAAREIEWIGFPLEGGIAPVAAKAIREWVDGVKIVGEFSFSNAYEMLEMAKLVGLDAVQAGTFTQPAELAKLAGIPVIKEVVIQRDTSEADLADHLRTCAPWCEAFLLDFEKAGISWDELQSNSPFSLSFLKITGRQFRLIYRIGLPVGQVFNFVKNLQPYGISLSGGGEEKTGFKSFEELDEILDQLEAPE